MVYTIAGRWLVIEALDEESATAIRKLFAGWFFDFQPIVPDSAPDCSIRIRCGSCHSPLPIGFQRFEIANGASCSTDGQTFYLDISGSVVIIRSDGLPLADIWLNPSLKVESEVRTQVISYAVSAALRRCGLFEMHSGGVVAPSGNTALVIGPSGSGKSTITFQLVAAGWRYLSDDVVLLSEGDKGIEARGLRRSFALTRASIEAVKLPRLLTIVAGSNPKLSLAPEDYFPDRLVQNSMPSVLLFSTIVTENKSRFEQLTEFESMARLLKLCPWACYDRPVASRYLGVLAALAKQCTSFDIFAGNDLIANAEYTSNLLTSILEKTR